MELVDDGYELGKGLALLPLPGHTPGQLGVRAEGAVPAIFCGDAIHSPLQVLDPALSTARCVDPGEARRVRRALLEKAVEGSWLVVPAHFRGTRCMRVVPTTSGFLPSFPALKPEPHRLTTLDAATLVLTRTDATVDFSMGNRTPTSAPRR